MHKLLASAIKFNIIVSEHFPLLFHSKNKTKLTFYFKAKVQMLFSCKNTYAGCL